MMVPKSGTQHAGSCKVLAALSSVNAKDYVRNALQEARRGWMGGATRARQHRRRLPQLNTRLTWSLSRINERAGGDPLLGSFLDPSPIRGPKAQRVRASQLFPSCVFVFSVSHQERRHRGGVKRPGPQAAAGPTAFSSPDFFLPPRISGWLAGGSQKGGQLEASVQLGHSHGQTLRCLASMASPARSGRYRLPGFPSCEGSGFAADYFLVLRTAFRRLCLPREQWEHGNKICQAGRKPRILQVRACSQAIKPLWEHGNRNGRSRCRKIRALAATPCPLRPVSGVNDARSGSY